VAAPAVEQLVEQADQIPRRGLGVGALQMMLDRGERHDWFESPEIVIEVLSPSNTMTEMLDREKLCLENGCQEFWVVDIERRQVKISTPDGRTITYRAGQEIPLPLLNGGRISVDAIFAPAEG
jgi:Uma2 family endonuclease